MRLTLLGTGSAEGFPGMFCACAVCRKARERGGRDLRSRTSALIDNAIKLDFPPDTFHHVLSGQLDLTAVEYLLFTHSHDDHFAVPELQYMSWMFVKKPPRSLTVLGSEVVTGRIQQTLDLSILPIQLEVVRPRQPHKIGRWSVLGLAVNHMSDEVCLNYVVSDGATAVLYATDTGEYPETVWRALEGQRLAAVVVECTKGLDGGGYMAHMGIPDVLRMRERMLQHRIITDRSRFVTTHHSHMAGMLHEDLEEYLTPHGIEVGYDGMTIDV